MSCVPFDIGCVKRCSTFETGVIAKKTEVIRVYYKFAGSNYEFHVSTGKGQNIKLDTINFPDTGVVEFKMQDRNGNHLELMDKDLFRVEILL